MKLMQLMTYYWQTIYSRIKRRIVLKYEGEGETGYYQTPKRYAGKIVHSSNETNIYIKELIDSKSPFLCCRFGSVELYAMGVVDLKVTYKYANALRELCNNAGFFPKSEKGMFDFAVLMRNCCSSIDVLGIWNVPFEHYYVRSRTMKRAYLTYLRYLEPWYSSEPWTKALAGKRVLVVHPFEKTIRKQYLNREKLFDNKDILPEFELITIKAVQTVAGECDNRFSNWFQALNWMYEQTQNVNYDIALIGCGAYGLPLAEKIKKCGKQAIHMGGVLQILFGIKGKRWDNDPVVSKLYNEFWVRPDISECPQDANLVEEGCYW